jgi:DNA polymerase III delta subunit
MPYITSEKLAAQLQKEKPLSALLMLGDEPYIRDTWRTQIVDKLIPAGTRDWAVGRYSADRGETQNALEQAQTLPMLSSRQVVFLQDVEKIEKLGEKNREAAIEQLDSYLNDPAPFTMLVLEAAGLDLRMKLAKLLAEKTHVLEIGLGENPEQRHATAVQFAETIGKEQKVEFERGAAEDLAELVAADLMRLQTEIIKLATFVGER